MSDELKPCPFCGGKVIPVVQLENAFWIEHADHGCLVFTDGIWASDYEWNTRAKEQPNAD